MTMPGILEVIQDVLDIFLTVQSDTWPYFLRARVAWGDLLIRART
jgi:hypothetical protein